MITPNEPTAAAPATPRAVLIPDSTEKLTRQTAFDRAYRWALTHPYCAGPTPEQGGEGSVSCEYRSADGTNACLFGCLIPDSLYDPTLNRKTAAALLRDCPAISTLFAEDVSTEFLTGLQRVHDLAAFGGKDETGLPPLSTEQYHSNLRTFAAENGLTVPAV